MAGANTVELITTLVAVGALFLSVWTNYKAARRGDIDNLQETICVLQTENKRLTEKVLRIEAVNDERGLRIAGLETTLREATQGRVERLQYIRVLEAEDEALRAKVKALEKEIGNK